MRLPFTATETSVSVFINGKMRTLSSTMKGFDALIEHLKLPSHDPIFVENIIDLPSAVVRWTNGLVSVFGSTVYFQGNAVHSTLTRKLLEMLDAGFDAEPWANFLVRIEANPSERSRACLFNFLEKWQAPLTDDGCFIAFKYVRSDYMDQYSGKFDNSPGKIVQVTRTEVDPDPTQTCSHGLHVCASSYLDGYIQSNGSRTVAVKVDPADVVAVPHDYGFAKMRVCRYEVIGDVEDQAAVDSINEQVKFNGDGVKLHPNYIGGPFADEGDNEEICGDEFLDDLEDLLYDDDAIGNGDEGVGLTFYREGMIWSSDAIEQGVADYGQRGFSKVSGIPRTTLQDWLARIRNES